MSYKLTPKRYEAFNRTFNEQTLVKLLLITPTKSVDRDNQLFDFEAGLEFVGQLEEKLRYGNPLCLGGLYSLKTQAIALAVRTDQGRLILTDTEGGVFLLEILFQG